MIKMMAMMKLININNNMKSENDGTQKIKIKKNEIYDNDENENMKIMK